MSQLIRKVSFFIVLPVDLILYTRLLRPLSKANQSLKINNKIKVLKILK